MIEYLIEGSSKPIQWTWTCFGILTHCHNVKTPCIPYGSWRTVFPEFLKNISENEFLKEATFLGGYHSQTLWILLDWNSSLQDRTELGVTKEILRGSLCPLRHQNFVRTSYKFRWFLIPSSLYYLNPPRAWNLTLLESLLECPLVLSKWVITPI